MISMARYIAIVLIAAAVLVGVCIYLYNRRLDKVTKGETRDTHSFIPEPGTTAGVTYRTVLLGLVIVLLLTVSAMSGKISAMQSTLNNLQQNERQLSWEIELLKDELEGSRSRISSASWSLQEPDFENNEAEIEYSVSLKDYSDDTAVSLNLNGRDIKLEQIAGGTNGIFSAKFTADLFADYREVTVSIQEEGKNTVEVVDFPENLFWDCLPMPSYECRFKSDVSLSGKLKYEGSFALITDRPEDIASVMLTYMTGGEELKTLDITKEAINRETIEIEQGLDLKHDLCFKTEITTKDGYKISEKNIMIYETIPDYDEDEYLRITDPQGNIVWESDKY